MDNHKPILDPLLSLLHSRKFMMLVLDAVVSVILHYAGGPDAQFLIAVLQPIVVAIIIAISVEDAAEKRNGS